MTTVLTEITGALTGIDYWKLTTLVLATFAAYVAYEQYRLGRERFNARLMIMVMPGAGFRKRSCLAERERVCFSRVSVLCSLNRTD
jgi:hypothetical protein